MSPSVSPTPLRAPSSGEGKGARCGRGDIEAAWAEQACGRGCGRSKRRCWLRLFVDGVLYLIVLALLAVLLLGVVVPSHTIISCHDPAIRRTARPDTIPVKALLSVAFLAPFPLMLVLEWLLPPTTTTATTRLTQFKASIKRSGKYWADLLTGGLFMYFLTDLIKTLVGEARPCFWDLCRPNLTKEQCEADYIEVRVDDCTNPHDLKYWRLAEAMKSFPSGHASISVYAAVFMMAYTHRRLWGTFSRLLSPCLQLVWAVWALLCCQTRVWDNRHFWWDVLAGVVIGAACSLLTLHYLNNWFQRREEEEEEEEEEEAPRLISKEESSPSPSPTSSSSSYIPEEEEEEERSDKLSQSRNSFKRLIGGRGRGGGGKERELGNIASGK